jgi:hypothetical protein
MSKYEKDKVYRIPDGKAIREHENGRSVSSYSKKQFKFSVMNHPGQRGHMQLATRIPAN